MSIVDDGGYPEAYKYLDRALDEVHTHLRELKIYMGVKIYKNPMRTHYPDSYLFTVAYMSMGPMFQSFKSIHVPIAILTSDGMLHFLTGTSFIDLKVPKGETPEALLGSDRLA